MNVELKDPDCRLKWQWRTVYVFPTIPETILVKMDHANRGGAL
jgi:hypothetical protein